MTTTIRMTRNVQHTKSDALREDLPLAAESVKLAQWLAVRDIGLVTMNQVLAFVRIDRASAKLDRNPITYHWIWDPVTERWFLECVDRGVITYELDEDSPAIQIHLEIAARY